jgi:hypothetical protein
LKSADERALDGIDDLGCVGVDPRLEPRNHRARSIERELLEVPTECQPDRPPRSGFA